MVRGHDTLQPVEPEHEPGMNPSYPDSPSPRLLIVDDEEPQMNALCDALRVHGYDTVGFTSAKAGLAALRQSKFDLLLSDLIMPEMDGTSLLRSAVEIDRDLVGVIMTGQGTIETAVDAMKTGALDFILKPFQLSDVLLVLSRALATRRLRLENADLQRRIRRHADEVQRVNQELEAFTHSVSHDLRAPLRAIGGFSKILLKDFAPQLPEEALRLLDVVVSSAAQLTQMIDGLLNFCRLGRQSLSMQPIDLASLVKQALDNLRRDQNDRQLEVKIADLPRCLGDPGLLNQVFANLLSNAFKFTAHTENPLIEIGCLPGNTEHTYFVRDNGIGFDMQYAERLFGVFVRLHPDEEFEGHGLGLSIVQRIIQRHGGRIWAQAQVNKGATFFFTLPSAT
jgi:two-component system sensor histidine kinase/response regulator